MSFGPVTDPAASNWRSVVYVTSTFPSGATFSGSGVMIGPNDVLTAAHVLYMAGQGGAATSVTITPAYDPARSSTPFGAVTSYAFHYFADYDPDGDGLLSPGNGGPGLVGSELDVAVVDLSTNLGEQTGWMQIDTAFTSGTVNVTGYPSLYGSAMMNNLVTGFGSGVDSLVLYPGAQLYPGNSGGPVWYEDAYGAHVVGVVSTASWAAGLVGTYEQILQWMAANDGLVDTGTVSSAGGDRFFPGETVDLLADVPQEQFHAGANRVIQVAESTGTVEGGTGVDAAVFVGARSTYAIARSEGAVIVTDKESGAAHVLHNVEQLRFSDALLLTRPAPSQLDFGSDGRSEVLLHNLANGEVALWDVLGAQTMSGKTVGTAASGWAIVGNGDFNGDGRGDILWRDGSGMLATWEMDQATLLAGSTVQQVSNDWKVAGTGNFNSDVYNDILWRNDSGQVGLWEMKGSSFLAASVIVTGTANNVVANNWQIEATGDFNGDGKTDILWRDDNGDLGVWEMFGSTIAGATVVDSPPPPSWNIVGVGDFNGDHRSDILWRNPANELVIWHMDGGHHTAVGTLKTVAQGETVVGVGDFNGDGRADILFQDRDNDLSVDLVWDHSPMGHGTLGMIGSEWIVT